MLALLLAKYQLVLEFSPHVVTSIDPCLVFVGLAGVGEVWVGGPGYLGPSEG